jgi:LmbE family N-acetylglucosaminyl deacetylase
MPRKLAAVFAHPDDETFSMGGTIALHTGRGDPFSLYCATSGDAGRASGLPLASRAAVGEARRAELAAALSVLGAGDLVLGDHRDGALPEADADGLVGEIVRFIRERTPNVVVTFGPEGAPTGHRDHRAISRAATAAFFLAARATEYPEQVAAGLAPHAASRLYYITWPDPPAGAPNRHEGTPATARVDTASTHAVELRAFLAHRSQLDFIEPFRRDSLTATEDFALVAGAAQPAAVVGDLFAGLP